MGVVTIRHRASGIVLAHGPEGWGGVLPFVGRLFVKRSAVVGRPFVFRGPVGLCPIRGVHQDGDLVLDGAKVEGLVYRYLVPNPLLPYLWGRIIFRSDDPALEIVREEGAVSSQTV